MMKKSIKRIAALLLTAIIICSCFAGCSSSKDTYTIGICQLVQHEALDEATRGFKEAVVEKLGEENVEFKEQLEN